MVVPVNYLVISDIHLSPRTSAEIINNLTVFFDDFHPTGQFTRLDILFIAGDLLDNLLEFDDPVVPMILTFWDRLIRYCQLHDIKLRLLKGTPFHDREQLVTLAKMVELSGLKLDFKYINDISIEHIEAFDLHVLYVPDESRPTAEKTQEDVQVELDRCRLAQVDIAIMHGMFKFQLGNIPMNHKVHDEMFYLTRTKGFVSIGHIHTFSQHERILAQGSFDRLAHGQPEPKGGVWIRRNEQGEYQYQFVENKLAKMYVTVEIKGQQLEPALRQIEKVCDKLPPRSHVQVVAKKHHPIFKGLDTLREKYREISFKRKSIDVEKEIAKETGSDLTQYTPMILNRQTLTQAVFEEITRLHDLSPEKSKRLYELLEAQHVG